MSLADEIAAEATRNVRARCTVGVLLDSMSDEDRSDLIAALASPEIRTATIYRALAARGVGGISEQSLGRHRKAGCACPR